MSCPATSLARVVAGTEEPPGSPSRSGGPPRWATSPTPSTSTIVHRPARPDVRHAEAIRGSGGSRRDRPDQGDTGVPLADWPQAVSEPTRRHLPWRAQQLLGAPRALAVLAELTGLRLRSVRDAYVGSPQPRVDLTAPT